VTGHQMPRPESEREAWMHKLSELPALLGQFRREVEATPEETAGDKDRREALQWRIRRAEKRMADLRARLQGADHG